MVIPIDRLKPLGGHHVRFVTKSLRTCVVGHNGEPADVRDRDRGGAPVTVLHELVLRLEGERVANEGHIDGGTGGNTPLSSTPLAMAARSGST